MLIRATFLCVLVFVPFWMREKEREREREREREKERGA